MTFLISSEPHTMQGVVPHSYSITIIVSSRCRSIASHWMNRIHTNSIVGVTLMK